MPAPLGGLRSSQGVRHPQRTGLARMTALSRGEMSATNKQDKWFDGKNVRRVPEPILESDREYRDKFLAQTKAAGYGDKGFFGNHNMINIGAEAQYPGLPGWAGGWYNTAPPHGLAVPNPAVPSTKDYLDLVDGVAKDKHEAYMGTQPEGPRSWRGRVSEEFKVGKYVYVLMSSGLWFPTLVVQAPATQKEVTEKYAWYLFEKDLSADQLSSALERLNGNNAAVLTEADPQDPHALGVWNHASGRAIPPAEFGSGGPDSLLKVNYVQGMEDYGLRPEMFNTKMVTWTGTAPGAHFTPRMAVSCRIECTDAPPACPEPTLTEHLPCMQGPDATQVFYTPGLDRDNAAFIWGGYNTTIRRCIKRAKTPLHDPTLDPILGKTIFDEVRANPTTWSFKHTQSEPTRAAAGPAAAGPAAAAAGPAVGPPPAPPPQLWHTQPGNDPYTDAEATKDIESATVALTWFVAHAAPLANHLNQDQEDMAAALAVTYHEWWNFEVAVQASIEFPLNDVLEAAVAAGIGNATLAWVDEFHTAGPGSDPIPEGDMANALLRKAPVEIVGIFTTLFEQYYNKCASFFTAGGAAGALKQNEVYRWGQVDPA
jgi:hypothetical protein